MRHITPCLLIAAALALSACSADSNDAPSNGSDENSSNSQDSNASSNDEAKEVIGTWEQEQGADDYKFTLIASVTEDVITIEWDLGSDKPQTIWIGSFDAAKAAQGETVTSKKDSGGVDEVMDGMMPDTLDFKLENEQLKFTISTDGFPINAELKKSSDKPTTVNEIQNTDSSRTFENDVLDIPSATIKITGHHVVDPGQPGNQFGDKPVIVFDYEMTNKVDKDLKRADFTKFFTAIQDNDENSVNELQEGFSEAVETDNWLDKIKKGGTVKGKVSYDLDDLTTPVTLKAADNYGQIEVGEHTYKLEDSTPLELDRETEGPSPKWSEDGQNDTHSL